MSVFKISCTSDCGTYFEAYLQSVTVIADSKQEAIQRVHKWMNGNYSFLYPQDKWRIEEMPVSDGILDYHYDSDY